MPEVDKPAFDKIATLARRRILIVDDEPFATHVLGRLLRRNGYVAAELNDSTKAASMARRFNPDIVLLDVHMPWKDGHEVAADFAADDALCRIPIIYITADEFERDTSTGTIPVLVKPFSLEELFARLKEGVARRYHDAPPPPEEPQPLTEADVDWSLDSLKT